MHSQTLKSTANGQIYMTDIGDKLFNYFDRSFQQLAGGFDSKERHYPVLLEEQFLKKIDFFSSFPHQALVVKRYSKNPKTENPIAGFLPRAVCYHYFASLAFQKNLKKSEDVITTKGCCFRHEQSNDIYRLKTFTMREVIFRGSPEYIESLRQFFSQKIIEFAIKIGLRLTKIQAQDPFFLPLAGGKYAMQKLRPLKHEFCFQATTGLVALSSSNNHLNFFTSKLLKGGGQNKVHSGCIAFGLERWVVAFIEQHGEEENNWPAWLRKNL